MKKHSIVSMTRRSIVTLTTIAGTLLAVGQFPATAAAQAPTPGASGAACDLSALDEAKSEFLRLATLRRFDESSVSEEELRQASADYVSKSEACYESLYQHIDDDGVWYSPDGSQPFVTHGTKWGAASPFPGGTNVFGPRVPGGRVTFSFMANGVNTGAEGAGPGPNVAISSLPTYAACFFTEIRNAFAAWAAVADIQFQQVADNGVAVNGAGAAGDIRIGAHVFNGPSGTLAHGYYPPPNGATVAGDIHFDVAENWSCAPGAGLIDIGIVALHEIGHAIGLNHEVTNTAVMNPFYNAAIAVPLVDDIKGATSIYGAAAQATSLLTDFGPPFGTWVRSFGAAWAPVHPASPEGMTAGDLDGNGIEEMIFDFGAAGLWVRYNGVAWVLRHPANPTRLLGTADLDNNGKKELVVAFPGAGTWVFYNNTTWSFLHALTATRMAAGNVDLILGDDLVLDLPGAGLWFFKNNAVWQLLNPNASNALVVADIDASGRADVVASFPGFGIWRYMNNAAWVFVHPTPSSRIAAGRVNGNLLADVVIDFGAAGIWMFRDGAVFQALHPFTSQGLQVGDFDGNGLDDIAIDFGAPGLWMLTNLAAWINLHPLNPESMTFVDLN
jgi:hypothetical protein